jgi:hypothetical protein
VAPRTSATFAKRQKERARQEKQQAKQERKLQRRLEKREGPSVSESGLADSNTEAASPFEPLRETPMAPTESTPTEREMQ